MNNEKHIDFLKSIIRHLESNVKVSDTIVIHNIKEYIETIKENKWKHTKRCTNYNKNTK